MADLRISEIPDGGSPQAGDDILAVRAGNNVRIQASAAAPMTHPYATTAEATAGTATDRVMSPILVAKAIAVNGFGSANAATTAQASGGTSDGAFMTPVTTRHAIDRFAFTSANIATSAQATAGTSDGAIMTPNAVRNSIEKFAITSANAATTAQASGATSNGTFLTPVVGRVLVERHAITSANAATTAQASGATSDSESSDYSPSGIGDSKRPLHGPYYSQERHRNVCAQKYNHRLHYRSR
jgi:hypothetical protein